jgi:hypothetical protein
VDILPDREAATVEVWLSARPEIRFVSRDRGGYGQAVARALPKTDRQRGRCRRNGPGLLHDSRQCERRAALRRQGLPPARINETGRDLALTPATTAPGENAAAKIRRRSRRPSTEGDVAASVRVETDRVIVTAGKPELPGPAPGGSGHGTNLGISIPIIREDSALDDRAMRILTLLPSYHLVRVRSIRCRSRERISRAHGKHQVAQRLRMTTFPLKRPRFMIVPSSSRIAVSGAGSTRFRKMNWLLLLRKTGGVEEPAVAPVVVNKIRRKQRRESLTFANRKDTQ